MLAFLTCRLFQHLLRRIGQTIRRLPGQQHGNAGNAQHGNQRGREYDLPAHSDLQHEDPLGSEALRSRCHRDTRIPDYSLRFLALPRFLIR